MKIIISFISLMLVVVFAVNCESSEPTPFQETYHIRKCVFGQDCTWEYSFRDIPEDVGYITYFPLVQINQEIDESEIESISLEYKIYPTISDAEMAVVEYLSMSNEYLVNMIEVPFDRGKIGHNGWHAINRTGSVRFIRNNIVVVINPRVYGKFDPRAIERIARKIDSLLIAIPKVHERTEIPLPVVNSISVVSEFPTDYEDNIKIRIDAVDMKGKKVFYRKFASGFALYKQVGDTLMVGVNEKADLTEDPNILKIKFWVWNTDHYVNSVEKYVRLGEGELE